MSTDEWARVLLILIGSGGTAGFLSSLLSNRESRRAGIAAGKREAERDAIGAWDRYAEKLERDIERKERDIERKDQRLDEADAKLQARAVTIRRMADHIDSLEAQVRELGGNPLPRPTNL